MQILLQGLHVLVVSTGNVRVLDAQQEAAAGRARNQEIEQSGPRITQVQ